MSSSAKVNHPETRGGGLGVGRGQFGGGEGFKQ